jgi:hypothetical protein
VASCIFMAGFIALSFDRLVGTLVQDFLDPKGAGYGSAPLRQREPPRTRAREEVR